MTQSNSDFIELSRTIREDRGNEAKKKFIDEVINLLARGIKLYDLPPEYAYNTAIYLIEKSNLAETEKEQHRENFANAVIFTGITGFSTMDFDAAIKARDGIIEKLKEV